MATEAEVAAADEKFKEFMRGNLRRAAEHFALTVTGEPVFGWRLRSIGARAHSTRHGDCWLRVVSEFPEWAHGDVWTGNADANAVTGVDKPQVLDSTEWNEADWRVQRAEVCTLVVESTCSATEEPPISLDLPDSWWTGLRANLDRLGRQPTQRRRTDQDTITRRLRVFFGDRVDPEATEWTCAHGDLHWGNLTAPDLTILDWEHWGLAPAGYDAATLLCYSLAFPDVAARVQREFHDVLTTPSGVVAQLHVVTRLLLRIENGDYPHLAVPLHRHAQTLVER
ncbi:MAG: aminoglycoside phosphotransferase [Stackebrandtia sp.]